MHCRYHWSIGTGDSPWYTELCRENSESIICGILKSKYWQDYKMKKSHKKVAMCDGFTSIQIQNMIFSYNNFLAVFYREITLCQVYGWIFVIENSILFLKENVPDFLVKGKN